MSGFIEAYLYNNGRIPKGATHTYTVLSYKVENGTVLYYCPLEGWRKSHVENIKEKMTPIPIDDLLDHVYMPSE